MYTQIPGPIIYPTERALEYRVRTFVLSFLVVEQAMYDRQTLEEPKIGDSCIFSGFDVIFLVLL